MSAATPIDVAPPSAPRLIRVEDVYEMLERRDREWLALGVHRTPRETGVPNELAYQLARLIVEAWARRSEASIYRQAIDAALAASLRTRTRPTRRSTLELALAWLGQRLEAELDVMLGEETRA